ncbi:MAG: T9SS type A sorting domain-containing protein [Bacteroidia bacterium]|nr:T9SS type A sorting domain-containing protein [Bacteroidia bacterium]
MDLFGICSEEVLQTVNAWNAVGVESGLGFGFDMTISCPINDYAHVALNNITMVGSAPYNCTMQSGHSYILSAGNSIRVTSQNLSPGNRIIAQEGCYFHAFINCCLENNRIYSIDNNIIENSPYYEKDYFEDDKSIVSEENNIKDVINFVIFPNPNAGNFILSCSSQYDENITIIISDIFGNTIYKNSVKSNPVNIDISRYSKGMYIVKATISNNVFVEKILYQ